jgi:hypothetical protein
LINCQEVQENAKPATAAPTPGLRWFTTKVPAVRAAGGALHGCRHASGGGAEGDLGHGPSGGARPRCWCKEAEAESGGGLDIQLAHPPSRELKFVAYDSSIHHLA